MRKRASAVGGYDGRRWCWRSSPASYTTSYSIMVPTSSSLIGYQLGAQGLDLFAPGACALPVAFSLSNEIIVTVL